MQTNTEAKSVLEKEIMWEIQTSMNLTPETEFHIEDGSAAIELGDVRAYDAACIVNDLNGSENLEVSGIGNVERDGVDSMTIYVRLDN